MSMTPNRILLKLSGEALMGDQGSGIDPEILERVATEIMEVQASGVQVALVIGGGNLFRGAALSAAGMDRVRGDQMGMLATVMNALALQDTLERLGGSCKVMTALGIDQLGEAFSAHRARQYLDAGHSVICAAGTGSPFFTTDTAASLRAVELQVDLLLKATKVDGIYTADPKKDPEATRYDQLSFDSAIEQQLGVMDLTAMVMCRDNNMPLRVFDMFAAGALQSIVQGESVGTLVEV
ncbi:MAG: Uridine monophosphate kinase (EC [uncultured Thiotrichaceae bacterium]|uniref:Uridylate kinase n=1 Tax=uncultured Thiotrichaceae bacterium TaxID=298394 RepID=A0A6S6UB51_9GAMM|nr:MAG: Uridine monophosphate kinase (EC [uncultured Thiotrichaceae bacterium]